MLMTWQIFFYLGATFDSSVPAGDFQISSDSLHTAADRTDQWERRKSGGVTNRKPLFLAAGYVAGGGKQCHLSLIGLNMGGGRMAGQDRSMLGGMKALILVGTQNRRVLVGDGVHLLLSTL